MKTKTTYYYRNEEIKASLTLREYTSGNVNVSLFDSVKKEFVYEETFDKNESYVAEKLYSVSQKELIPFFDKVEETIQEDVKLK